MTINERVKEQMDAQKLDFTEKPILIGGMAMEYYGLRKAGDDIDLVIPGQDYEALARSHPEKRKDIYGDLGVVLGKFEIWRSITLLDYSFFKSGAVEEACCFIISLDRLLLTRVCAMHLEKYRKDLELIRKHYCKEYANAEYRREAREHESAYKKCNGVVFGGKYEP